MLEILIMKKVMARLCNLIKYRSRKYISLSFKLYVMATATYFEREYLN